MESCLLEMYVHAQAQKKTRVREKTVYCAELLNTYILQNRTTDVEQLLIIWDGGV